MKRKTKLLKDRSSVDDLRGGLIRVLLEVLVEQLTQLGDFVREASGGGPAVLGVKQLVRNTRAVLRNVQVEGVIDFIVGLGEVTAVDGVEDGTGVLERATLATGGSTGTNPAGVEQPGVSLVLGDLVGQHAGVTHGVQSQERLSKARGEGSLGLGHPVLGAGHLGGVARDEVEHGLLGGELGDRGQHATGVAGQQDDVGRVVVGAAGDLGVVDELDRVRAAGVLRQGAVVVVDVARDGVEDHVLQHGAEADRVVDVGLLLGGQPNALGVAASLDVEHALVGPAVLVVTDQFPLGVGRQRGLASPRQTEENGHIALLTLVGRRVERQDVVLDRHLVEENREHSLLHLPGVLRTQDHHLLLGKVDRNRRRRGHTLREPVGGE